MATENTTLSLSLAFSTLATSLSSLPPALDAGPLAQALSRWSRTTFDTFVPTLELVQQQHSVVQAAAQGAAAGTEALRALVERVPEGDRLGVDAQTLSEIIRSGREEEPTGTCSTCVLDLGECKSRLMKFGR
jgi:hypothetical protein